MKKVILCLLLLFFWPISSLYSDTSVTGRYVQSGSNTIIIQLNTSPPPPAAFIVQLKIPAGLQIKSASPDPAGFNSKTGSVKWLIKQPQTGASKLSITTSSPIGIPGLKGEIRFRHPKSGRSVSNSIQ